MTLVRKKMGLLVVVGILDVVSVYFLAIITHLAA